MTTPSDDHPCTIDEIVAALTSPARAEELQGEEALVDAIAAAVIAHQPKELVPMTSRSRRLKIGLLAGAVVLSLAGVAAAATTTRVLPDRKPSAPVIAATTTLSTQPRRPRRRRRGPPRPSPPPRQRSPTRQRPSPTHRRPSRPVPAPRRHRSRLRRARPMSRTTVSTSATSRNTPPGPDHGKIVSAAAQSDCGKVAASDSRLSDTYHHAGQQLSRPARAEGQRQLEREQRRREGPGRGHG